MKILHIIPSVNPAYGGPIEGILRQNEACGGRAGPVQRHIACLDVPGATHLEAFPLPVHALGHAYPASDVIARARNHYRYSPRFLPWIRQNVSQFDTVFVHGLWNYASFAASQVLPKSGIPYFCFAHGMMDPWFRQTYPFKHLAKQALWLIAEGRLLAGAKTVFFTSEEERRLARGVFFGHVYGETVIGYGSASPPPATQNQEAQFTDKVPQLGTQPFFLFLGRIHPKKGCDLLVEAFGRLAQSNIHLVVAGPDPQGWSAELEARATALGISNRVHWPGPLYGDAKWGALRKAEVFVLPSHQENFGIAVAEALSCGTPVLISDKVNIWREIEEAEAGFVAPDTIGGTEVLLESWLNATPKQKQQIRDNARSLFEAKFNVVQTGPALIDHVRNILRTTSI